MRGKEGRKVGRKERDRWKAGKHNSSVISLRQTDGVMVVVVVVVVVMVVVVVVE